MPNSKKRLTSSASKPRRELHPVRNLILSLLAIFIVLVILGSFFSDDSSVIGKSLGTIVSPVQRAFTGITAFFRSWFGTSATSTESELEELRLENELLKIELQSYDELERNYEEAQRMLGAQAEYEALSPVYAKVIAKDMGVWFSTFTINKGQNDGISRNMAVVNADGLIGRVNTVGYNYCTVISIIDPRSSVASLIGRTRDNGMLQGYTESDGGEVECRMYYLSNLANVRVGDEVYTSGLDSRFPKGIYIGTVIGVSRSGETSDKYVSVKPAVSFTAIEEVFVLREQIETIDELPPVPTPTPMPIITPAPTVTSDIYSYATKSVVDDNAVYSYPTPTPDPNVTPAPTPTPRPTKPVPEAEWLKD